ncbi:putative cyclase [Peptoanaerobacter stomatis]|uniref:Kynurenine formamidase n=1 Tax=Peptoanaerobacter stomatis TaxID=796937 RepID=J6HHQ9_9FIRM|nr:cyclase family protein [Peptoanaerobacter stomatis]EJU22193.1 putative cyclase [Peptoanaerobacter stomatis]NWO24884.1 cyclase family protein [Peptostreptococcaceae bacterium oral taxon 081]
MKIYDVSKLISEDMVVYKNREEKRIKRTIVSSYETGDYYESRLDTDLHCGTHIDAPLHMVKNGNTIDKYNVSKFIGKCKVFDLTNVDEFITKKDIESLDIQKDDRVIFKTKNSYDTVYNPKFVYIEEDAAEYLAEKQIQSLGIDAMSIERDKKHHPTHKIILGANIGVIEDMMLKDVNEGEYFLSALPLKIKDSDASPIRAVLIEDFSL